MSLCTGLATTTTLPTYVAIYLLRDGVPIYGLGLERVDRHSRSGSCSMVAS